MSNNYVSLCSYPTTLVLSIYIPFISTNYCIWSTLMFHYIHPLFMVPPSRLSHQVPTLSFNAAGHRQNLTQSLAIIEFLERWHLSWASKKRRWKPLDKNIGNKHWETTLEKHIGQKHSKQTLDKNIGTYGTYWKTCRTPLKHLGEKRRNVGTLSYRKMINTWWIFSISMLDFRKVNFWVNGRWIFWLQTFTGSTLVWSCMIWVTVESFNFLSRNTWFDK